MNKKSTFLLIIVTWGCILFVVASFILYEQAYCKGKGIFEYCRYYFIFLSWMPVKWGGQPKWISGILLEGNTFWDESMFCQYLFELYSNFMILGRANSQLICCSVLGQYWDAYTCPFPLESCWHFTGSCYIGDHCKNNCSCICC